MAQQLSLDLPSRTALGRDAFFVSPSNAVALAMIEGWQSWSNAKLLLLGPAGSGKTHLAHVWAQLCGARIIDAQEVTTALVPDLVRGPLAVEDLHRVAGDPDAEAALFHLHNLILSEGHPILFSGSGEVASWPLSLPDLASRLSATTVARLDPPDDTLLSALLVKLLADRQITPKPNLIPYLLLRMDRSFEAAQDVVEALDRASLALKRPVTRKLAGEVLDKSRHGT